MIEIFLIGFGGVTFLLCVYGLLKMLTTARARVLEMVNGDILAFVSLIAWMLTFIAAAAYWVFSSIDFYAAKSFRLYVHSFTATYFFEGALCLLLTYGLSAIDNDNLRGGKRTVVIAAGILFGLLAILLGVKRLIGG